MSRVGRSCHCLFFWVCWWTRKNGRHDYIFCSLSKYPQSKQCGVMPCRKLQWIKLNEILKETQKSQRRMIQQHILMSPGIKSKPFSTQQCMFNPNVQWMLHSLISLLGF
jgi:hypothetical protein